MKLIEYIEQVSIDDTSTEVVIEIEKEINTNGYKVEIEEHDRFQCTISGIKVIVKVHRDFRADYLIHELLHGLLVARGFPDKEKILTYVRESSLTVHLYKFITDFINDIHHFIFYQDFLTKTAHLNNVEFIDNETKIIRDEMYIPVMINNLKMQDDKEQRIKEIYEPFITIKYINLFTEKDLSLKQLREVDEELYDCFECFFVEMIRSNFRKIENTFLAFFKKLDKYINR